jgi:hypothetical protein
MQLRDNLLGEVEISAKLDLEECAGRLITEGFSNDFPRSTRQSDCGNKGRVIQEKANCPVKLIYSGVNLRGGAVHAF